MQVTGLDPATHRPLTVTVTDGRITTVSPGPPEAAADCYLAPGLVDLQVNGFHGYDVNADDITPDTIAGLVHELRREGVTTFCPTVITASEEKITHALRTIAAVRRADPLIAHAIPRLHVEGPHISDQDGPRGVHPSEHVRPPDLREFQRWQDLAAALWAW